MPGFEAQEEVRLTTPFGEPSEVYVVGRLEGKRVAFLARHGRGHRISPSELNFRANIFGMKMLGVERILSLSAVGSLKEEHAPLDFVIPDQFFDRTQGRESTFFGDGVIFLHQLFRSGLSTTRQRCSQFSRCIRHSHEARRHVSHGRSGIFNTRRIERIPQLGHGCDRNDESSRSQASARG